MSETNSKALLSARKQQELEQAIKNCVDAGVQYNLNYVAFEKYEVKIDDSAKRDALKFLLDDMLEITELGFQMSPIIEKLGDPATVKSFGYREFKLLQELIKNVRIKGRDNHIRLSQAMKAFNEPGNELAKIEEESRIFAKAYQEASTYYAQLCKKFGILPEDLDGQVEEAFQAKLKEIESK